MYQYIKYSDSATDQALYLANPLCLFSTNQSYTQSRRSPLICISKNILRSLAFNFFKNCIGLNTSNSKQAPISI